MEWACFFAGMVAAAMIMLLVVDRSFCDEKEFRDELLMLHREANLALAVRNQLTQRLIEAVDRRA